MEFGSDWGGGWDYKEYEEDKTEKPAEEKNDKPDREKEEKDNNKEKEENHYDFFEEIKKEIEQREKEEAKEKQRQEVKEDLKIELEEDVKGELKEELREEVQKDLRVELEEEVKKDLRQEFEEQIKKELKTELKGQVKKELEEDLSGEVREEIKKKLTNEHSEIKRDLTELTESFRNSEHCNDASEEVLNNLLKNDYPFQNRDGKETVSALSYLGLVICNECFDKAEFSNLASVPNEKIKDRLIEFHKYLDDDLLDNLFEKYDFLSKNDELSSEIRKLKEKMEKLIDKNRELLEGNERLRERLVKSKEKIEGLSIGKKQIEKKEGDDESNEIHLNYKVDGERTDAARDVFSNKFKENEIPDDFFYKEGQAIQCKDVEVLKNLYGKIGSYEKLQKELESKGYKNVPSYNTLWRIIRDSFESEKKYQRWMKDLSNRFLSEEKRAEVIELVSRKDHDSLHEIERITGVSRNTVKNIAQEVWGDNYKKEFPYEISEEKRAEVIELVSKEDHDSLNEISRITGVSLDTVKNIAQEIYGDDYEKEFPHPDRLSEEKRTEVIELVSKKDHDSLTEISRITGVSHPTVGIIAQEIYGDDYKKEFPYEISEEKRAEVIELVSKEDHDSLNEISRITGVSLDTVKNIAQEIYGDDYEKEFPTPDLSEEKIEEVIELVSKEDHDTLKDISRETEISKPTIRRLAQDFYGGDYEKEFPRDFAAHKGVIVHSLGNDLATRSFDEKRKQDPNIPKYYSEIMIFKELGDKNGDSKHPDGGFPNDMGYLRVLLTDEMLRELKLDSDASDRNKIVIFDYTNELSDENIINKIIKYQHAEIMFFIVGTNWYHDWVGRVRDLPDVSRVKYPNNIRVINIDLFADLIDLEDIYREKLREIIRLNKNNDLDALVEIKENTNIMKHDTNELREAFKEVFSDKDGSLDRWLKKKNY